MAEIHSDDGREEIRVFPTSSGCENPGPRQKAVERLKASLEGVDADEVTVDKATLLYVISQLGICDRQLFEWEKAIRRIRSKSQAKIRCDPDCVTSTIETQAAKIQELEQELKDAPGSAELKQDNRVLMKSLERILELESTDL